MENARDEIDVRKYPYRGLLSLIHGRRYNISFCYRCFFTRFCTVKWSFIAGPNVTPRHLWISSKDSNVNARPSISFLRKKKLYIRKVILDDEIMTTVRFRQLNGQVAAKRRGDTSQQKIAFAWHKEFLEKYLSAQKNIFCCYKLGTCQHDNNSTVHKKPVVAAPVQKNCIRW